MIKEFAPSTWSWYGPINIGWVGFYPQGTRVNKFVFN